MITGVDYCSNCYAITPSDGPTTAPLCALCGHTEMGTVTRDWIASAIQLAKGLSDGYCLYDTATSFTCGEAEMFAEFMADFGCKGVAETFLKEHAEGDDEGDTHGIDEEGNLFRRD
ncbi:hypothetical protein ACFV1L_22270 [Kitasatospora sp. NPDC059646]|uniref:hypothetical protein n=1 Tax=Kitasatospora sp. NPDC059646 TaxID=3346893 RepID=UPI0036AD0ED1